MKNLDHPPLHKERLQTDASLTDERGKTDESFESYRVKTEAETDKIVSANRLEADEARLNRRTRADVGTQDHSTKTSQKDKDAREIRLENERKSEDVAIQKERRKNDLAIGLERDEKDRLLNKLFSQERLATDKNLFDEREKTDLDTLVATELLTVEKAAHSDTKSALTTREEFVAIVSHDLKNPIGSILSAADMLTEETSMSEDSKRWVEMIRRNAQTSLRLISDILEMERIVEGKIHLQPEPCRLHEIIFEVVESLAYAAAAKGIQLKIARQTSDDLISCDRDRIYQVLTNLLGNALKFTPNGGSICVSTEESENETKVSIIDTGIGIPEDQRERIFERFAQIGNKTRSGLGLGLYISKTLIDSHHGRLWVQSSDEHGSQFCFTLPHGPETQIPHSSLLN